MTEAERIISDGILPPSFFIPETICDFYVDEFRKKVWAIEIDLLIQLDRVCQKHHLKYFLSYGTLLGAIRHHGFIPWDDDIDINMPRGDYEILKTLGSEFEEPYFLQYPGCDNEYYFSFAKLRNSNTSGISSAFRYDHFNQGIWIDIFPMDKCDMSSVEDNAFAINGLIAENSAWMRLNNPFLSDNEKRRLSSYKGRNPIDVFNEMEAISRQYENEDKDLITCAMFYEENPKRMVYRESDVWDMEYIDFYGYKFPIPKKYDLILRTSYGDYMQFPPIEERGTWHDTSYFNPDIPYLETLEMLHRKDHD